MKKNVSAASKMGTNIRFILRLMKLSVEFVDILQTHSRSGVEVARGDCLGGYVKFPDEPSRL
jgi:hypothetical protein